MVSPDFISSSGKIFQQIAIQLSCVVRSLLLNKLVPTSHKQSVLNMQIQQQAFICVPFTLHWIPV